MPENGDAIVKYACGGGKNDDCPKEAMWCGWCSTHCSGDEYHSYHPDEGEFDDEN